ncbi:hypothetical protein B9Z19DRAFT_391952 [Tuber borchii]|uniref:Uncharacterized protein n=1 Tax=Tuber borchii TaxID=42251 RepID=A0A2T6ZHF9_TUBBO|nr:hypothetical protein B9Z19DRAFT_391952 [Tuber borchii]
MKLLKNDQIDTNRFSTCHGTLLSLATPQIHTDSPRLLLARKGITINARNNGSYSSRPCCTKRPSNDSEGLLYIW